MPLFLTLLLFAHVEAWLQLEAALKQQLLLRLEKEQTRKRIILPDWEQEVLILLMPGKVLVIFME